MISKETLRYQVQILARCIGSALQLGTPIKVEVYLRANRKQDPVLVPSI